MYKMKVKILTKNNCSGCIALKLYLKDNYKEFIEYVNLEDDEDKFYELANELDTTTMPAIALYENGDVVKVVRGFDRSEVNRLFMVLD